MWNPNASAKCGTPWVDMQGDLITRVTGFRLKDLLTLEPAEMLRNARGEPKLVENDDGATVYQLPVPGTVGVPATALGNDSDLIAGLERQTLEARVRIPRDDSPIEVFVDVTPAVEAVAGSSAGSEQLTVSWLLGRTTPHTDVPRPAEIADSSCLS